MKPFHEHNIEPVQGEFETVPELEYRFGMALVATTDLGQVGRTLVNFAKARGGGLTSLHPEVEEILDSLTLVVGPALKTSFREGREKGEKQKAQDVASKLGLGILK